MNSTMGNTATEKRYTPLIILLLVAALVVTLGLWAKDRAAVKKADRSDQSGAATGEQFHWKMVTTWPKNFPGLGMAAENFARIVEEMTDG